jgi:hypothetical protein
MHSDNVRSSLLTIHSAWFFTFREKLPDTSNNCKLKIEFRISNKEERMSKEKDENSCINADLAPQSHGFFSSIDLAVLNFKGCLWFCFEGYMVHFGMSLCQSIIDKKIQKYYECSFR